MRIALLLAALSFMNSVVMSAQRSGELKQSLAAAQDQSDIFNRALRPFLLEADLTVLLAAPTRGHLTIQWQSKNHWRREMTYGPYKESVVRNGEQEYAQRNVGFAPLRTSQIVNLLQFAQGSRGFEPNKTRTRKRGGTALTCIELRSTDSRNSRTSYELCTNPVTHDIATFSPWIYGSDDGDAEFSDYAEFEGMRFPRHLELRIGKDVAVTATVTKLEEQTFDAGLLTPPQGATERRFCDVMTAPVMIQPPDMSHLSHLGIHLEGLHLTFQVTILKDGSVGSIQVIGRNSVEAADAIRMAFRSAKFKPALCGTEPVIADIDESLNVPQ